MAGQSSSPGDEAVGAEGVVTNGPGPARGGQAQQARQVEVDGADVPERAASGDVVLRMELDEAVAALPPRSRDVFVLHDVLGYRAPEIAASLGITELTVRSHVARARSSLRQRLGPDLEGGQS